MAYCSVGDPSPWTAFAPASHIASDLLSDDSLDLINSWMRDCRQNHEACNERKFEGSPRRLLSISWPSESEDPIVRLRDTVDGEEYSYAALSYYWRNTTPVKTTADTISAYQENISWSSLPDVFQDAIKLSSRLQVNYIWIDSLCIIQDSASDMKIETSRTPLIFNRAAIMLAAHGPKLNLSREGTKELTSPLQPQLPPNQPSVFVRGVMDHDNFFNTSLTTDVYLGRAWHFQERLFAPRILHFGGSYEEIVFECNVHCRCECGHIEDVRISATSSTWGHLKSQLASSVGAFDATTVTDAGDTGDSGDNSHGGHTARVRNNLWETYIALCEDYTAKGLSHATDNLAAFSSLAHYLHPRLGKYYAGLWEHNLILSLQWEALDSEKSHRQTEYTAPSFSWASRTGPIVWYYFPTSIPRPETHTFASILDISCVPATDDPFGPVSSGSVTLRGFTVPMFLKEGLRMWNPDGRVALVRDGVEDCFVILDSREDLIGVAGGMEVTCLDVMRDKKGVHGLDVFVSGLVLLPVESPVGAYRRIGFSTMRAGHFEGAGLEDVTIV